MSTHQPNPAPSSPRSRSDGADWSLADLMDFEFFLQEDQAESPSLLEERDHRIFTDLIQPSLNADPSASPPERRRLFHSWLEARRRSSLNPETLPGHLAGDAWRVLVKILALMGLASGAGLAANLLHYDGHQPVNVAAYLGWLVLVQIGLILLAGGLVLLRRSRLVKTEFSLLGGLLRWLWFWLTVRLHRHVLDPLNAERRSRLQAFFGSLAAGKMIYGPVLVWPALSALQRFGVFFNGGALAATLTLVMFSDRAFGWQSALNVTPEQIHQLVHTLSSPWAWALPEAAGPSLAQIAGSKIILKDGIKQLTTQDLVSWWPFLCLALAFYGLLPRALLWVLAGWWGRRSLRRLSFQQVACDRLHERLLGPRLHTAGLGREPERQELPFEDPHRPTPGPGSRSTPALPSIALIPHDLLPGLDQSAFLDLLHQRFHWSLSQDQIQAWPNDSPGRDTVLSSIAESARAGQMAQLLLLDEAWQPPIAEKLSTLRDLRQALGPSAKILLLLIGRPQDHSILTPVSATHWKVWERQIASLGDPRLRLESLAKEA